MKTGGATRRRLEAPDWVYAGLCVAVLVAVARFVAERNWGGDYWEHAAAAAELARHPLAPANPYTGTPGDSVLLDTWHLLVGLLSRSGLGVEATLAFVAVVQLVAVLAALRVFARRFVAWRWAPPCFLVAALLFWGWQPWRWSGFVDFNGLGFVMVYPATGATALMLYGTVTLDRWIRGGSRNSAAVALVCVGLVGAWSPMTLLPAAVLAAAVTLSPGGAGVRRRAVTLAAVAAAGLAGLLTTRVPPGEWAGVAQQLGVPMRRLWADVAARTVLALPGILGLVVRARRLRRVDTPALAAVIGALGLSVGWLVSIPNLGRLLIPVMLCLHLGWVELLWWAALRSPVWRRGAVAAFATAGLLGLAGAYSAVARAVPPALLPEGIAADFRQGTPERTILAEVTPYLSEGDVVADVSLQRPAVFVVAGAHVLYTNEDPLLADKDGRRDAVTAIAADGPAATDAIARYGVTAAWCLACDGVLSVPGATVVTAGPNGTLVRFR